MKKGSILEQTWFTILMLVLFFPLGIFLMYKNNLFTKQIRIGISVGIVAIGFIGVAFGGDTEVVQEDNQAVVKEEAEEKEKPKEEKKEEKKELTLDELIKEKADNVKDVTFTKGEEPSELNITLTLSDGFSNNFMRSGAYSEAYDICRAINEAGKYTDKISNYKFTFFTSLVDKHGNEADGEILYMDFKKEDIEKINWVHMYPDKFSELADPLWIHPALRDKE